MTSRAKSPAVDVERLTHAAINLKGAVHSLPAPARHRDVARDMLAKYRIDPRDHEHEDGFVTSTGRFVNRVEGARVAFAAGQLRGCDEAPDAISSQDVW